VDAESYLLSLQEKCFDGIQSHENLVDEIKKIEKYRVNQANLSSDIDFLKVAEEYKSYLPNGTELTLTTFKDLFLRHELVNPFLATLPSDISSLLFSIPFGTLPTRNPNASSIRSPDGNPIVVIDDGLLMIISHY